jgi:hypothetical protein
MKFKNKKNYKLFLFENFIFAMLEIKPRDLYTLGKHCSTEP